MKFRVIVVGKAKDRLLGAVIADYEARAARYWPLAVIEVREEEGRTEVETARRREGERILERASGSAVIACDERGDALTSRRFAAWMQQLREEARDVSMVIGGANGLDDAVRSQAVRTISLAPWTLPHEIARLVLAEQLYRAGTVQRGEPYHRD